MPKHLITVKENATLAEIYDIFRNGDRIYIYGEEYTMDGCGNILHDGVAQCVSPEILTGWTIKREQKQPPFTIGNFYKTRGGEKAECVGNFKGHTFPWRFNHNGDELGHTDDGMWDGEFENEQDIIGEWEEEKVEFNNCESIDCRKYLLLSEAPDKDAFKASALANLDKLEWLSMTEWLPWWEAEWKTPNFSGTDWSYRLPLINGKLPEEEEVCSYCLGLKEWSGDALPKPIVLGCAGLTENHCGHDGAKSPRFSFRCPACLPEQPEPPLRLCNDCEHRISDGMCQRLYVNIDYGCNDLPVSIYDARESELYCGAQARYFEEKR